MGQVIGPRVSKVGQTSPTKINYHVYQSEKRVIKAFTANNFVFFDKSGHIIDSKSLTHESKDLVTKVKCIWQIQKNHHNCQSITISADIDHLKICPV